jgi:hypothetical protein
MTLLTMVGVIGLASGCASLGRLPLVDAEGRHQVRLSNAEPVLAHLAPYIERAGCIRAVSASASAMTVRCDEDIISIEQRDDVLTFHCWLSAPAVCELLIQRFAPPAPWDRSWRG